MDRISRPRQTHSLERELEARQHCINYNFSNSLRITSHRLNKNTQTTAVCFATSQKTAIILTRGGKKKGAETQRGAIPARTIMRAD